MADAISLAESTLHWGEVVAPVPRQESVQPLSATPAPTPASLAVLPFVSER